MRKAMESGGRVYPAVDEELFADLKRAGHKRIALQVPAGMIPSAAAIGRRIELATGATVIHLNRACFGACDPPTSQEALGHDAVVTLGHAPIPNMHEDLREYYVEMRVPGGDARALAERVVSAQLPSPIGLVASIQHMDLIHPLVTALDEKGMKARVGTGGRRLAYPGQALGCNYASATSIETEVKSFLFLGTGRFHPIGLAFSVTRPVWALDPLQSAIEGPFDREGMVRKRLLTIAKAMDARKWGILVSVFAGQDRTSMAVSLEKKARERGMEACIVTFDRLDPRDLMGRDLDAYVSTACPRIALDDGDLYYRPLLTPQEFLSAIGERPLLPYLFDTFA